MASARGDVTTLPPRGAGRSTRLPRQRLLGARGPTAATARDDAEAGERLHFSQVVVLFRRNFLLLSVLTLVSMAATFASIRARPPVYEANAQIVMDGGVGAAAELLFLLEYVDVNSSVILTQTQILASRTSLGVIADDLELIENPRFNPALRPPSTFSLDGLSRIAAAVFGADAAMPAPSDALQREMTIDELRRALEITLTVDGLTVTVTASADDPLTAALIANGVIDQHLALEAQQREDDLDTALSVLRERADNILNRIQQTELRRAQDIEANNLNDRGRTTELLTMIERTEARRDAASASERVAFVTEIARLQALLDARTLAVVRRDQQTRELETDRRRYQQLLERIGSLETGGDALRAPRPPLSRAAPPVAEKSRRLLMSTLLGGVGMLLLGLLGVFVSASIDARVRDPRRLEELLRAPCLAVTPEFRIPSAASAQGAALHETLRLQPRSPFSEAMRRLSVQIAHQIEGRGPQVLAVTSSVPGEGKSTIALCMSLAARPKFRRIAIVDFDLRGGGLTATLADGADVSERLTQRDVGSWLDGETPVSRLPSGFRSAPGVDVLPTLVDATRPVREFNADQLAELFDFLRESYDLAILDLPPILPFGDVEMIAPHCDGVLMVVGWEMLTEAALQASTKLLDRADAPVLGVALNRVELRKSSAAAAIAFRRKQLGDKVTTRIEV